ncbi:hypothetical protein [Streptomyces pimonensis]|uniref:hypothetical protein n=1 Tax=Streptomyces pimonensis TaxID=2860288 RepID=UPI003527F29B
MDEHVIGGPRGSGLVDSGGDMPSLLRGNPGAVPQVLREIAERGFDRAPIGDDMIVPPTAMPITPPTCRAVLVTADPAPDRSSGRPLISAPVTGGP